MTLALFLTAWGVHLLAAASPGPAILMSARLAVTDGFKAAGFLSIGLAFGAVFWALAAIFGLNILFELLPSLFFGFKLAGALFLIWMGIMMWVHAKDPLPTSDTAKQHGFLSAIWLGIVTQLANPKPAIFFGAVFAGLVPPQTSGWWIAGLMLMIFVNELLCTLIIARLFSIERSRRLYLRLKSGVDRCFGGLLAVLGLKIVAT